MHAKNNAVIPSMAEDLKAKILRGVQDGGFLAVEGFSDERQREFIAGKPRERRLLKA